uniref:DUF659 domain-containing protein n=1 Tax=Cajanus cajan TaxID=3821 RepID=A0A151UIM8_CAJCA
MWEIVVGLQQNLIKKSSLNKEEESIEAGDKRKGNEAIDTGSPINIFKKRVISTQATINTMFKKGVREEACQAIARFFYNNAVPFNVAKSEEFFAMFDLVSRHGLGFKPPSYHEIRVKLLKEEVKNTSITLQSYRDEWEKNGCTIMIDGWTDKKRRTIINFLVNSPKGTLFLKSIDASAGFQCYQKSYLPLWSIIDERWDKQLHKPLHAADYFLNPQMHYRSGFKADLEVKRGLMDCLTRMVKDEDEQTLIDVQIDDFKK